MSVFDLAFEVRRNDIAEMGHCPQFVKIIAYFLAIECVKYWRSHFKWL